MRDLRKKVSCSACHFEKRWLQSNRKEDRFLMKNKSWQDTSIGFPMYETIPSKEVGRPMKSFTESSQRTKRQKTELIRTQHSPEELEFAAQMSLRASGQVEPSKVVKEVTSTTPKRAARYRSAYKKSVCRKENNVRKLKSLPCT